MQSSIFNGSNSLENSEEESSYSSDNFEQEVKIEDQNLSESSKANITKV